MATTYNNLYLDTRARLRKAGIDAAQLEARELLGRAAMVENCGLPGERMFADLTEKPDSKGYFTTVIIP